MPNSSAFVAHARLATRIVKLFGCPAADDQIKLGRLRSKHAGPS